MLLRSFNWLLTIMLSAVLAILAAHWSWQLYALFNPAPLPPAHTFTAAPQAEPGTCYNLAALQQQPLFGHEQKAAPVVRKSRPRPAPRPRSNLKLVGLIGGPQGVAIIRSGKEQLIVMTGETLKLPGPEQTLMEINPDHIIISRNGRAERLDLQDIR
ncbi:MAG: hypothetical protein OIF57_19125 [Marinobacterium sp.]|nr:hypothetical protein [Marinobacterium sp.]